MRKDSINTTRNTAFHICTALFLRPTYQVENMHGHFIVPAILFLCVSVVLGVPGKQFYPHFSQSEPLFVTPAGHGVCSFDDPCQLAHALEKSSANPFVEIVFLPGHFTVLQSLSAWPTLSLSLVSHEDKTVTLEVHFEYFHLSHQCSPWLLIAH